MKKNMEVISADATFSFRMNPILDRYLLDEEFLDLLNKADVPLTVIGECVSVPYILFPKLKELYRHFHGREL